MAGVPAVSVGQVWLYLRDGSLTPVMHVVTRVDGEVCESTSVFPDGTANERVTIGGAGCGGAGMAYMLAGRDPVGSWTFLYGPPEAPSPERYRTVDGVFERFIGGRWIPALGTNVAPNGPALSDRLTLRCMCEVDGREQTFEYPDGGDRSVRVVPRGTGVAVSVSPRDVARGHVGMIISERSDVPVGRYGTVFPVDFSVLEVVSVIRRPSVPRKGRFASRLEEVLASPDLLSLDARFSALVSVLSELLP